MPAFSVCARPVSSCVGGGRPLVRAHQRLCPSMADGSDVPFPSGPEKNTRAKESPLPAVIFWGIHLCITVKESRGQRVLAVQQMENVTLASSRN